MITRLQACVRQHLFFLFDVTSMKELIEKNPPITDEEMESFLNGEESSLVCSLQHFRVDFQRPWKDTSFNQLAKEVFVQSFLATEKSGEYDETTIPPCLLTPKVVGIVLDKHMEYRRKQYRQHLKPLSEDELKRIAKRKAMTARRATVSFNPLYSNPSPH